MRLRIAADALDMSEASDFTDLNTGYVSASVWDGTGAVAKTTDGGAAWVSGLNTNPLWDIDFPISGASLIGYAVGENGTILKTFNAGSSWPPQQSGTSVRLNGVYFLDLEFGFAVGDNGIILRTTDGGVPVELTSFSATVNEKDIILNWTTATEINNLGFEIEKLLNSDWVIIGFVEGNGTTTEPKAYSFKDENLDAGIYKYRLKQIDLDGKFEYSEIVEAVESSTESGFLDMVSICLIMYLKQKDAGLRLIRQQGPSSNQKVLTSQAHYIP